MFMIVSVKKRKNISTMSKIRINLRGYFFEVTSKDIEKLAKSIPPSRGRRYITVIEGRTFSPKDLVAHLIAAKNVPLTKADFTTMDAIRILRKLGFKTEDTIIRFTQKKPLHSYAGVLSLGGDSLKDGDFWHE